MRTFRVLLLMAVAVLLLAGCGPKKPQVSMTQGHARIGVSGAIYDFSRYLANAFETTYPGVFVDINWYPDRMLVDSLLNEKTEQIMLDRTLMQPESAAFAQANLKLYTYRVAYFPVYLLVPRSNPVKTIDSTALRNVLAGRIQNWSALGGSDERLRLYIPNPGEGAWASFLNYFGRLDTITAVPCSTSAAMLDSAKADPGALLAFSEPVDTLHAYKALYFHRDEQDIAPNYKTIMDSLNYPFRLNITYVTTHEKEDAASGYLTYIMSNVGQRRIGGELKYRPAAIPVRFVKHPQQ
jgi:hypothetical protein